jgi:hypothetical protein
MLGRVAGYCAAVYAAIFGIVLILYMMSGLVFCTFILEGGRCDFEDTALGNTLLSVMVIMFVVAVVIGGIAAIIGIIAAFFAPDSKSESGASSGVPHISPAEAYGKPGSKKKRKKR